MGEPVRPAARALDPIPANAIRRAVAYRWRSASSELRSRRRVQLALALPCA
jgi:hypothetical protein